MRKKIAAGNWKMNTTFNEGVELAQKVDKLSTEIPNDVELIVAPPFTHLFAVNQQLKGGRVKVSSQNCAAWDKGAYTGEVSAAMLASMGIGYAIIGHSERREYFGESNQVLLQKVKLALQNNLVPIYCCGEVLAERDNNTHFQVVQVQIEEVINQLLPDDAAKVIIAYEPVWAIGTGRTATPEQAQEMHAYIRSIVSKKFGENIAQGINILYGGSCKPDNAAELFAKHDVDGGLIGGASLKADDFIAIAKSFPK